MNNAFGFYREYDGYKFMCVFARKKESVAPKLNFSAEKSMMNIVWKFLNQILPYYQQENSALKYSRISQDASFRKNFIFGQYKSSFLELKDRERGCLFWARYGKSTSETSKILGLKRATVKKYLEGVREKCQVSSIQEAITLALQHQFIS
ncbi:helix-turn-helix transcriptional regulator [Legionella sainthelensi]|uniref:HTH luxR-type domain-containing protein n=1 Tax=Legionella sainthelensi TaxID=28087 RepID=A0A2H5FMN0_9GAMM|nr:helix-turn-helix transcriptional regulator [Legionella sainthelensi]AUH72806.1 LuxR family transcriptional regulator [Legionella sainthelensi]